MRHHVDGLSLVFGLVFGLVAVAGLNGWIGADLVRMEWLLPAVLVTIGLVLLGLLVSRLGRRDPADPATSPDPVTAPDPDSDHDAESA